MVDRIIIDSDATNANGAVEPNRPLIHEVGWFDWIPTFGSNKTEDNNPLNSVAQKASKRFDEDMNPSTGRTSTSMMAAIDAYAQIPVNTPEGAYMWSHADKDGKETGGIINDWKLRCEENKYTNLAVRGSAILFTAEGEAQLKAGSLLPDVAPYDMRRRGEPLYVLSNYKNGNPVGYDLGSTGLMSLYEAKRDAQLESDDPRVSSAEKDGLKPVLSRIIDDIRDVVDVKHDVPDIISQLSEKHYPKDGYDLWKQYITHNVMPMVDKAAWTEGVEVDGKKLHPINTFMRNQFVAKTWRDLATLDLADIDHSIAAADKAEQAHDPDTAAAQRANAINKFLGEDGDRYKTGYKGVWQAIQNGEGQNNPDAVQLRQQAQIYGQKLEQHLEKLAKTNPQKYTVQLQMIKTELGEMASRS